MYLGTRNKLVIVSRRSNLAMCQARLVQQLLMQLYPELKIDIHGIATQGDKILNQPLNQIGGKGLFVKELELCLLAGEADIAVHSMKDMPAQLPPGLKLGPMLLRADPRDVLCSINNLKLDELPAGAVVGTSSLRRKSQLLALRNDLVLTDLRGNVESRLQKLERGDYSAIILAAAGLQRLGLKRWLDQPLSIDQMLPAVGQGVLGIEYREGDNQVQDLIASLNNSATAACITAERSMNAILDGGCQAPVAGFATIEQQSLTLRGLVATADGQVICRAQHTDEISQAVAIGEKVAADLIRQGARQIIQDLKLAGYTDG